MIRRSFPEGFLWGVATSSHQIEGAFDADGRGESIWDRFAKQPGAIADGTNASQACDHYHRWREDIDIMRWMGVRAYRFSIAWSRVFPDGSGTVNEAGLDFYDTLVDALLDADIEPVVTLYHWDLPQALQDRGGWASRATAQAFTDYTEAVVRRLGDRVTKWVTHNEPWCIATLGHENGEQAPGHRNPAESLTVAHHVLLSHGWALDAIRAHVPKSEAGIVLNLTPAYPATESDADRDAVRHFDGTFNRWYLDPLYRGQYPEDVIRDRVRAGHIPSGDLTFINDGDMEVISRPTDFLGVNYYSRAVMKGGANGWPEGVCPVPADQLTDMGWEVFPDGLHDLLVRVHRDYKPKKIYITENGAAYSDGPDATGKVADERRVDYFRSHLAAAHRAIQAGVPLVGYFAWSLLDNFEWAHGFEKRFGLVWVDYETQSRIPKQSAHFYRDVVTEGSLSDVIKQR